MLFGCLGSIFRSKLFHRHSPVGTRIVLGVHSLFFASLLFCPEPCTAADELLKTISTPRFTLHISADPQNSSGEPEEVVDSIASESIAILNQNYEELSRIFAMEPSRRVVLRFMSPDEFHRQTGAPKWTSAMYFRGEITVPIQTGKGTNRQQLQRALRHEYVHAVIAELSRNKAPAWIDEGLAQLLEGRPNPILGPSLRRWLSEDNPMPLEWLDSGFTTLEDGVVPAAYAQSLFATRTIVNKYGFDAVRKYLTLLSEGENSAAAFEFAFGLPQERFEQQLAQQLLRWAAGPALQP